MKNWFQIRNIVVNIKSGRRSGSLKLERRTPFAARLSCRMERRCQQQDQHKTGDDQKTRNAPRGEVYTVD